MRTTKEVLDSTKPTDQFRSLRYTTGGSYEIVRNIMHEFADSFTRKSRFAWTVNRKSNHLFAHLLECYPFKDDVRIERVEVQAGGFLTDENTIYLALPRNNMRMLAILKERGFTSVGLVMEGRTIPIVVPEQGLYALPTSFTELCISSADTMEGTRRKACKAIFVSIIVEVLNDSPRYSVANTFAGVEKLDEKGVEKMQEGIEKLVGQGKYTREDIEKGLASLRTAVSA